jgi:hypothetical protein
MTPWLLVVAGLFLALLSAGMYLFTGRGRRHTKVPAICGYLDENFVMNLYLQGDYEALKQDIEKTTRVGKRASLDVHVGGIGGQVSRESEQAMVSRYIREVGSLRVIGLIVDELDRKGGIVHVDLDRNSIEPGKGLDLALETAHGSNGTRREARLSSLDPSVFVSVRGTFQVTGKTDETIILTARYGRPDDKPGQVSVSCLREYFLGNLPAHSFSRCIGQKRWDPAIRKVVVDPVLAVYR